MISPRSANLPHLIVLTKASNRVDARGELTPLFSFNDQPLKAIRGCLSRSWLGSCPRAWCKSVSPEGPRCTVLSAELQTPESVQYRRRIAGTRHRLLPLHCRPPTGQVELQLQTGSGHTNRRLACSKDAMEDYPIDTR